MTTYSDALDALIAEITTTLKTGDVYLNEILRIPEIDLSEDNIKLRDFLIGAKVCTLGQWRKACASRKGEADRKAEITGELGSVPTHVGEFVRAYIEARGIITKFDDNFYVDGQKRDVNWMHTELCNYANKIEMFERDKLIMANLAQVSRESREIETQRVCSTLTYEAAVDDRVLDVFLHAILDDDHLPVDGDTSEANEERIRYYRAARAALRNWLWRIKNHMRGKWQHSHHTILVLFNPIQYSGKSTTVEWLMQPLGQLATNVDASIFSDNSERMAMARYFVLNFDELARFDMKECASIKMYATISRKRMRDMYDKASEHTMTWTGIGSTNKFLKSIFNDDTGMRRFFVFYCRDQIDRDALAAISATDLFRCVNEDLATAPIFDAIDEVREAQEGERKQGIVELWAWDDNSGIKDVEPKRGDRGQALKWGSYQGAATWLKTFNDWLELKINLRIKEQITVEDMSMKLSHLAHLYPDHVKVRKQGTKPKVFSITPLHLELGEVIDDVQFGPPAEDAHSMMERLRSRLNRP